MAKKTTEIIANLLDFDQLATLESNYRNKDALTPEVQEALTAKYVELGRSLVVEKTDLDLTELTMAEDRILETVSKYTALLKRERKFPNHTFKSLNNNGLIETAEKSVCGSSVSRGSQVMEAAGLVGSTFEQIIIDHPNEFSPRAVWYARKRLGLPNETEKAPSSADSITQVRTGELMRWWQEMRINNGKIGGYSNLDVGRVLGFEDLSTHGRNLGNITSRIDFACYKCNLPPMGLCAEKPFENAWGQEDRDWSFPVKQMASAAKTRKWSKEDLEEILHATRQLPGRAYISWQKELQESQGSVKDWAHSLEVQSVVPQSDVSASDLDRNIKAMQAAERDALGRSPEVKRKISRTIERGGIGALVKKRNGFKCQICEALGDDPHSFIKTNGEPFVEAHHVIPVSELQIGSLSATNIMTVCANHHRQLHFGNAEVAIEADTFNLTLDGRELTLRRCSVAG